MMLERELAFLDWDNTLRPGFTLIDWVRYLAEYDQFDIHVLGNMDRLMMAYTAGRISYSEIADRAPSLYAQGLSGQEVIGIQSAARRFVQVDRRRLFAFAWPFLLMLIDEDIDIQIISGCPGEILSAYVEMLGHGTVHGLNVSHRDGVYSSHIAINHASREGKKLAVTGIIDGRRALLAAGDSESDLPLFDNASIKLVFGNSDLLSSDPDARHLNPFGSSTDIMRFLSTVVQGGEILM